MKKAYEVIEELVHLEAGERGIASRLLFLGMRIQSGGLNPDTLRDMRNIFRDALDIYEKKTCSSDLDMYYVSGQFEEDQRCG